MIKCPSCENIIMKAYPLNRAKVRNAIIIVKGQQVFAVCERCKTEVLLPLSPIMAALPEYVEKLYVNADDSKGHSAA